MSYSAQQGLRRVGQSEACRRAPPMRPPGVAGCRPSPRRRHSRVWRRLLLGVFVMMTMTLAAGGRRGGLIGDRLDRGALADLAVQPLHGLVADDETTVRGDFLAGVGMFFPGNADRDMKRLDDHRRVGLARKSDQGEQSHDGENTLDFHRSHLFSPSSGSSRSLPMTASARGNRLPPRKRPITEL